MTDEKSGVIEVTAKKNDAEATINYDFGADLDEMVEKFGKDVTFSQARAQMKIKLQALMRAYLEAGKDCDDLATTWKPGMQMERVVDPIASAKKAFSTMDPAAKKAFLEELRNM